MAFPEEQYKFINIIAPHLSCYAELMEQLRVNKENREIEFLFRRMGHKQKFQFEAVIAHPRTFNPKWEKVVFKTRIVAYNPLSSVKYDFKSKPFSGLDSFKILEDYGSYADAYCNSLGLERKMMVVTGSFPDTYHLQGWLQGPVRNALLGHDYLRDHLGRGIGITGMLSYK
ncbi:MAG: hypothetical protein AABX31_00730 [Nanoarchaeota archaeon]